jgi:cytochrome c oxidase subunit 4
MSDSNSPQNHEAHSVRGYLFVYFALLAGTGLTVWASFIHFGSREVNIAVALLIAGVKAFLVAGYFMHLISEKKMIYSVLSCTAFFFVGLMFLTLFASHDVPALTVTH